MQFPYRLADGLVHDLDKAVAPSLKRDVNGDLGANLWYAAWGVVRAVPSGNQCSMAKAVAYMNPPSWVNPGVTDTSPASPSVPDVYDAELDAENEWDLSHIPLSSKIDVRSSLQATFTAINDKGVEYWVQAPITAAGVFKFALHDLNTLQEQRE